MAKRTTVEVYDDIDNSPDASTLNFSIEGVFYEIDVSGPHRAEFFEGLKKFVDHATRKTHMVAVEKGSNVSSITARRPYGSGPAKKNTSDIRLWIRSQGENISDRGRIPIHWMNRYDEAKRNGTLDVRPTPRVTAAEMAEKQAVQEEARQAAQKAAETPVGDPEPIEVDETPAAKKTAAKKTAAPATDAKKSTPAKKASAKKVAA